ncbi:Multidrug resistance protein Stp [Streptomyces sp. RB5]|uniref:Multidrug resistance protein Stp n=1 Tax=Streptomyces smaragdinus TaxID=2585196 RepID=A0A7K0CR42_9ACTN|nr:DHA2 family efflux MFS transporter permease subunit [Streptomyces smaragdinus]MQY15946.1 Multidrug resistance protein Stp [Streptomyces smaragdinus]
MTHDSSGRRGWTLVLASLGGFMATLDTLVVATALPVLRVDLGASLADLEWTVNAYNLALACLILTAAALGDRLGRKRMYVTGLALFTAASVAAALSGGPGPLIAARAVQGAGAALVLPLALTLIAEAFPAEKRGTAIGLWAGVSGLAVAAGPAVGGAIVEGISWQWIFWLNVPVGLVLIPLSLLRLTESHGPRPHLDLAGVVLAGGGLLALTWGPVRAPDLGWGSGEVVASLVAGAALVAGFLVWERRAAHPMLPLGFFRRPDFSAANAVGFLQVTSLYGALFLFVQLMQTAMRYSPLEAGVRILPWTATPAVVAPLAGALADRVGNRPLLVGGMTLQAVGLAWVASAAGVDAGYGDLVGGLVTAGVGISMCLAPVANAVVGSVPRAEAGVASGVSNALRQLGGAFGVALAAAVFARYGGYGGTRAFLDGFTPAVWVTAGVAALAVPVALFAAPRRPAPAPEVREPAGERALVE